VAACSRHRAALRICRVICKRKRPSEADATARSDNLFAVTVTVSNASSARAALTVLDRMTRHIASAPLGFTFRNVMTPIPSWGTPVDAFRGGEVADE